MSSAQALQINAYMSPHPLDEDSFLEEEWISWLPGYVKEETEDGLPSYYHDSNVALYEKIETFTNDLFKKAAERIWPLLKDHHFKKVFISIDYSNYRGDTSLAGYEYRYSNPGKGTYHFSVDRNLLHRYSAFLDEKLDKLPNMNIWEHELMHLLDHWEILKASSFAHSDLPLNNLRYYALKYREEGIANLLDLLDGKIKGISSIAKAKEVFAANYTKVKSDLSNHKKTDDKIRSEMYSGYDFYEVGPWIILDMLDEIFSLTEIADVKELEKKIANGEEISEELKLEIVRNAFYFDTDWFMSRLGNYCQP
jgi:hypothetical protein